MDITFRVNDACKLHKRLQLTLDISSVREITIF